MGVAVVLFIAILLLVTTVGYMKNMADISGIITGVLMLGTIGIGVLSILNML